jgi:hypothetical protein
MNIPGVKSLSGYLLCALVIGSVFVDEAEAFDSTPPKVESCTISPREISDVTGGTVRVSIKVVSINGLSSNVLSVLNLKNNTTNATRQLGGFIMTRESGDEFSSTWVQDIAVKPGLMPGVYELSIFPLTDKVQNGTFFLSCPGQDVSYGVAAAKPTPTPTPTPSATKVAQPSISQESVDVLLESNAQLKSQIASLQAQIKSTRFVVQKLNQRGVE